jgi:hypothetical protein
MKKNLIYIVSIDSPTSTVQHSDYAQYCINTWKYYCEKHNIDLYIQTEHDPRFKYPVWNKELIATIGKGYEKIGIVDNDTMVRWDMENIFDTFTNEFCAVEDNGNLLYSLRSIENYKVFFPDIDLSIDTYFNAGVLFFSSEHLDIFDQLLQFYLDNKQQLDNWTLGGGKEQTLLNYFVAKNNVTIKKLSPAYNLYHMHTKDMFLHNWQLNEDATPYFIKYGKIWHFTGFPVQERKNLMSQTWELIKDNYKL